MPKSTTTKDDLPIPWQQAEFTALPIGAQLLACSVPHLYRLAKDGKLEMVKLASGKVALRTTTLIALLDQTKAWSSSGKADASIAARARQRTKAPSKQAGPSLAGRKATGAVVAGRDFSMAQAEELHAEAQRRGVNIRTLVLELFPDPNTPVPAGPLLERKDG